jgi:glyoxylase-like metal-dependent hydrolase (beta-lactamase superfamily II)
MPPETAGPGNVPFDGPPFATGHVHAFRIGSIRAAVVSDGDLSVPRPRSVLAANANESEFERAMASLGLSGERIDLGNNLLFLETGEHRALIDAGWGNGFGTGLGHARSHLEAAGIPASSIDTILLTHVHQDHLFGLEAADGTLAYPNARYVIGQEEFRYWTGDPDVRSWNMPEDISAKTLGTIQRLLAAIADRTTTVNEGDEPLPGVTVLPAHGHTPGNTMYLVGSGGERVLAVGDVILHPLLGTRHPDWDPVFDQDRPASRLTRRRVIDLAATRSMGVFGSHFTFPGLGRIVRSGGGFHWSAGL